MHNPLLAADYVIRARKRLSALVRGRARCRIEEAGVPLGAPGW